MKVKTKFETNVWQVFVDPFAEAEEQLAQERAEARLKEEEDEKKKTVVKRKEQPLKVFTEGVGKYINMTEISKWVEKY